MSAGCILIFCTGKNKIKALCNRLRDEFGGYEGEDFENDKINWRKSVGKAGIRTNKSDSYESIS